MAEALNTQELGEALNNNRGGATRSINDLPNALIVSIFVALEDPKWVRLNVPRVCKEWNEIYRSKDASPLHETLEVDFEKEVEAVAAVAAREGERLRDPVEGAPRRPVVHASSVIAWAQGRASWVRKLRLKGGGREAVEDFSAKDLGRLVAALGPSLTEISVRFAHLCRRHQRHFFKSLRTSVVPAGRLRSLVFENESIELDSSGSAFETLGQLAGSLEELVLINEDILSPLSRFPESFLALKKLRRLGLIGHEVTAIPAEISSLKKLEDLDLRRCRIASLPKELGELSRLTKLDLSCNGDPENTPERMAFPAELGRMKSLRVLGFNSCFLRTVPAFVGKLESLESLDLRSCFHSSLPKELGELSRLTMLDLTSNHKLGTTLTADEAFPAELGNMKSLRVLKLFSCGLRSVPTFLGGLESLEILDIRHNNGLQIDAPLDFLIAGCPRLRWVGLIHGRKWTPESLAHLEALQKTRTPKCFKFLGFERD